MATKIKVRCFIFESNDKNEWELPTHWTPFQAEVLAGVIRVWAYRNGG